MSWMATRKGSTLQLVAAAAVLPAREASAIAKDKSNMMTASRAESHDGPRTVSDAWEARQPAVFEGDRQSWAPTLKNSCLRPSSFKFLA